ncbi:radical SAM protein [Streptomyces sp. MBT53]|uniref:radical SAM protein n=1 Tax=Streptomyces sp. MBT53 TaxID=1488384 RepID=UPI00191464C3|nr:radical SAM protein [Streptomyces sp. MBT53]MBK6015804.1 radical SAM protein [Streptomyces sp. MBT53]
MTITPEAPATPVVPTFLELEITQKCQLTCPSLCYAKAGPTKGHGTMTGDDWKTVISDAAALGVEKVQFIGGEATQHPDFAELLRYALAVGLGVQVYSNLYRVPLTLWELFEHPRVSLATSYYSDVPADHERVTGRKGSHAATRANIIEALRRGIHVQVGIVAVHEGQRVDQARADLETLGVTAINTDRVRGVGNAAKVVIPSVSELCGNCTRGRAAVMPDGQVTPCVLGRFLPAGNVRVEGLAAVFAGDRWAQVAAMIPPRTRRGCTPDEDSCMPSPGANPLGACTPADSNDCDPSNTEACDPAY